MHFNGAGTDEDGSPTAVSLIARIDSAGGMDTVFTAGDFWGRAILRDTTLRRRARLPVR